ncbi:hypothetical protein C427_4059 [Paraglaciecola psychrophila 170]|uniref:Uncharacterized protein n=1 Tax=Paraglaciecola psychrophila 170 TaxID=1129794 RepID=K6ZZS9_9ALTE|nr:hypothetical protein C427_4059 [Paraglaciecola psychrophila 170]GAC35702.1 hypothetical protein GPSY_0052 [Paraglaciecola psychrophila 170]
MVFNILLVICDMFYLFCFAITGVLFLGAFRQWFEIHPWR